jgi:hypothetical protein
MKQKKIKVFISYPTKQGDSEYLEKMKLLVVTLAVHPKVQLVSYPEDRDDVKDKHIWAFCVIERAILEAQLFVAVAAFESTGLGVELMIASSCERKTMLCFPTANPPSTKPSIVSGIRARNPNLKITEYSPENDLFDQIIKQVESML